MKKLGIVLASVALAFFAFVLVQKNKWETQLQEALAKNQLTAEISIELFPQPAAVLQNINTQQKTTELLSDLNLEKVRLAFDWFSLSKSISPNAVYFSQFESQFSLSNTLFNQEKFLIFAKNGRFSMSENQLEFYAKNTAINEQEFADLQLQMVTPSKTQENLTALLSTQNNPPQIQIQFSPTQKHLDLVARKIKLEQWLKALKLPVLISGETYLKASFNFAWKQGEEVIQVEQGKLNGIDGLNLLSRYLPINVNENSLAEKNIATSFDRLNVELALNENRLSLQKLQLFAPHFLAEASGEMDLLRQQCDFSATIAANNAKYSDFSLPIRLFGDCHSLQYKVEINHQFRQNLKNFIRNKFK